MSSVAQRSAEPPFVLAIDVGTTSVRAELFDRHAREVEGTANAADCPVRTTADGAAEIDPDELATLTMHVVDKTVQATAERFGDRQRIDAVGISTFWHSVLGIDEREGPTTPLLLWADSRSRDQMPVLRSRL